MANKKIIVLFLLLFTFPLVHADIGDTVKTVWESVLSVGSLGFLGVSPDTAVVAFTRILLVIFVFAVLFGVLSGFGGSAGPLSFLSRGQAGVVAGIIAILTGVFFPPSVILAIGTEWATVVSLLLLGAPILGLFFLLWTIPKDSCAWRFLRLVVGLLLFWIVSAMREHVLQLVPATSTAVTSSISQFIDWSLGIIIVVLVFLFFQLLFCAAQKQTGRGDWSPLIDFFKKIFAKGGGKKKGDDDDDDNDNPKNPKGERRLGPAPPPGPPPKPPKPNKGDDPKPVPNPPVVDPKGKKPKIPPYKPPPLPPPPKNTRTLIDLSPWFLSVRNQDGLGACAAFAGSSMVEYIMNRVTGKVDFNHKLSELFLWYNARHDKANNVGCYTVDLVHEAQTRGDCKEPVWSFEDSSSNKYLQVPPAPTYTDGLRQRVVDVRSVSLDQDQWIATLAAGNPMYIGIATPQNFGGGIKSALFNDAQWPPRGGHAMVLVGYDSHYPDGKAKNEAFKVRNSWGSGWGEQGYIWFPRNLLRELISRHNGDLLVFTGWEKSVPTKHKYKIMGRVVVDIPPFKPITDETGATLYHADEDYGFGEFKVGVMAQIKGKITILNEILVKDQTGRFVIEFEADQTLHEPLTELGKAYPQLKKINFKTLPGGVVVYKRGAKADDKEAYFHVVHFEHSKGGRGGEGSTHSDNPNSASIHHGLDCSGRPIVFLEAQSEEKYVIIPVVSHFDDVKHLGKMLEHLRRFGTKEKEWAEKEFKFLEEMQHDVGAKDFSKSRSHFLTISRAERKVTRLQNRLEKELREIIWNLPKLHSDHYKVIAEQLKLDNEKILLATSRKEGSIRHLLDTIEEKMKLLKDKRITPEEKRIVEQEIGELWKNLLALIKNTIGWIRALVVNLKKLEEAEKSKTTKNLLNSLQNF